MSLYDLCMVLGFIEHIVSYSTTFLELEVATWRLKVASTMQTI